MAEATLTERTKSEHLAIGSKNAVFMSPMLSPVSQQIWETKYCFKNAAGISERSIEETWRRVAKAAASAEKSSEKKAWEDCFVNAFEDFQFIPAGRILAGAGTGRDVTLFNCFVMGEIADDMGSIFSHVREAALTLQQGGGIGHDFSSLRPKGALVKGVGADASGPVSFMDVWDAMCRTIMSAGARRGAMMGTLRCDHPDIEAFIDAKADPKRLRNFNLSVLVTDDFMNAVKENAPWPLVFGGETFRTVNAHDIWMKIMRSAYEYAEPGVIFIDRVNARNNLNYCETIHTTNPCGEQPLPPYGSCLLGSINLARLVENAFSKTAGIRTSRLEALVSTAVRFLDNIIDVSQYPLPAQEKEARSKRRIGLGVTGLADALIMCGQHYGSLEGRALASQWMQTLSTSAYATSIDLAEEKGAFPLYNADLFLDRFFPKSLPKNLYSTLRQKGIRNGVLTSIAPTGTISLLAENVSSGIEPIFDFEFSRRMLDADGSAHYEVVQDYAAQLYRTLHPYGELPEAFVTAKSLAPADHLAMQAALQAYTDASISKTVNCSAEIAFEEFETLYKDAYALGLKGCTAYRPNTITGEVLSSSTPSNIETNKSSAETRALPLEVSTTIQTNSLDTPLPRDTVLSGFTYKLRWPNSDHAIYITINDVIVIQQRRPFEIFINSKNLEHYSWTLALTRMISAVFRRGGNISFVAEELKAIFDPRGGAWMNGRYVPSLLAAIGNIIEQHLDHIGFNSATDLKTDHSKNEFPDHKNPLPMNGFCERCGLSELIYQEGCVLCRNCGFSTCS